MKPLSQKAAAKAEVARKAAAALRARVRRAAAHAQAVRVEAERIEAEHQEADREAAHLEESIAAWNAEVFAAQQQADDDAASDALDARNQAQDEAEQLAALDQEAESASRRKQAEFVKAWESRRTDEIHVVPKVGWWERFKAWLG